MITPEDKSAAFDKVLAAYLGHEQIEIVTQYYVDGMTQRQIGEIHGLSQSAVYLQIKSTVNKLDAAGIKPDDWK